MTNAGTSYIRVRSHYTINVGDYQFGFEDCTAGVHADPAKGIPASTPMQYTLVHLGPLGGRTSPVHAVGGVIIAAALIVAILAAVAWLGLHRRRSN